MPCRLFFRKNRNLSKEDYAMYATKTIIKGLRGAEEVILSHGSIAEVCSWAKFNGLIFGSPKIHTPFFSVEHSDGSPISDAEISALQERAGEEVYVESMASAVKQALRCTPEEANVFAQRLNPYMGAAYAAVVKSGMIKRE